MTRSPDRPSEIDASSIYTPAMRSQNPSYSTITVHHEKKASRPASASRAASCRVRHKVGRQSSDTRAPGPGPRTPARFSVAMRDVRHAHLSLHHAFHARSEQIPLSSAIMAKFQLLACLVAKFEEILLFESCPISKLLY